MPKIPDCVSAYRSSKSLQSGILANQISGLPILSDRLGKRRASVGSHLVSEPPRHIVGLRRGHPRTIYLSYSQGRVIRRNAPQLRCCTIEKKSECCYTDHGAKAINTVSTAICIF